MSGIIAKRYASTLLTVKIKKGNCQMLKLKEIKLVLSSQELAQIPEGKKLINTINAYSYNNAQKDSFFAEALREGDYLIPDGAGIVKACQMKNAKYQPVERIAGWDLFTFEMKRLNAKSAKNVENGQPRLKVMFMGSSEKVLTLIRLRAAIEYSNLEVVTYSPPYKPEFSDEDNEAIINAINEANPDLLWIGMTAPKQEKWTYKHWKKLNIHCHVGTIGAVFDFFAGTAKRAPLWWQEHSLEWLYRFIIEPRRMWRRYLIGNIEFPWLLAQE